MRIINNRKLRMMMMDGWKLRPKIRCYRLCKTLRKLRMLSRTTKIVVAAMSPSG
jgi:hypothetical protein